jgi:hypothetical protein
MTPSVGGKRKAESVLPSGRESSTQAAAAKRIRREAPPWLGLATTRGLDEDTAYRQRLQQIAYGLPFLDPDAAVPRPRPPAEFDADAFKPLDEWLARRAAEVAATPGELELAESRAQKVIAALAEIYPGAEVYRTGSIAHGDAMSPLNDIDLGVIVTNRSKLGIGPGKTGPGREMEQTATILQEKLRNQFPDLTADAGNKRSIVLEFTKPQETGGTDFTCDVIIAIPRPEGDLLIPNTELKAGWDENDPQWHVARLKEAERTSEGSFSQTVRLVKHWRNVQDNKLLYSWNIKTLALEAGDTPAQPFESLYRFFAHAIGAVAQGPTENPRKDERALTRYPPPGAATERMTVTLQLMDALETLDRARMLALADQPEKALAELERLLPYVDPRPA